jgi:hypothetical protein
MTADGDGDVDVRFRAMRRVALTAEVVAKQTFDRASRRDIRGTEKADFGGMVGMFAHFDDGEGPSLRVPVRRSPDICLCAGVY